MALRRVEIIRKEDPYPSHCTYGQGKKLLFPGKYTRKNCLETCVAFETLRRCGKADIFTEAYLPHNMKTNSSTANTSSSSCAHSTALLVAQNSLKCDCPVACHEETIEKTTSYSRWPSKADLPSYKRIFNVTLGIGNSTITNDYIYDNFLKINVYFEHLSYQRVVEVP